MTALKRWYGGSPLHLLGHLAAFAVAAYALSQAFDPRFARPLNLALWLVGGALLHDLVFLPLYAVLDRLARTGLAKGPVLRVPAVNHVRVPAVMAATMLLVYFPLILSKAPAAYMSNTGQAPPDYAGRWLAITAGFFVASALLYAIRLRTAGRAAQPGADDQRRNT